MKLLSDWQAFPSALKGGVLCVGNFDGVHRGHAAMLSAGRQHASEWKVPFVIMTFDPHPSTLLKPDSPRPPLTVASQRLELLSAFHPDALIVLPTTRELLSMPAEAFLKDVVHGVMGVTEMVEGPSFTYGRGARGTVETLRQDGPALGFQTHILPTQQVALSDLSLVNVSSSLIRWLVEQGRVRDAELCLGRPYALRGVVQHGAKRGRAIGFPTANLATSQLLPAPGIYAGAARVGNERHRAAISVGNNPTFNGQQTTVEAFLLDFDGDLYDQTIDVAFQRWIRDMHNFAGVEPLVAQMNRDVALTRQTITLEEST